MPVGGPLAILQQFSRGRRERRAVVRSPVQAGICWFWGCPMPHARTGGEDLVSLQIVGRRIAGSANLFAAMVLWLSVTGNAAAQTQALPGKFEVSPSGGAGYTIP